MVFFRKVFIIIFVLLIIGEFQMAESSEKKTSSGIVLILNGPSSSGKTSIQKALQQKSPYFFLRVGIDSFFDNLIPEPDISRIQEDKRLDQVTPDGEYIRGISYESDESGSPCIPLHIGSAGDRIMKGMHNAIKAYASLGNNLVVDYILYKPDYLDDLKLRLKGVTVYWIGVSAPLDIIEKREKDRGTSPVGHARSHYESCHKNVSYDLKLDTSKASPDELADEILKFLELKLKKSQ